MLLKPQTQVRQSKSRVIGPHRLPTKGSMMSRTRIIRPQSDIIIATSTIQPTVTAREWLAALMQGVYQGGNTWLCLEVGTGTNDAEVIDTLAVPVFRKLVDDLVFQDGMGSTINGPSLTVLMQASLQTPDANGNDITEYGIYGGGLNLNQQPFGTGMLIFYESISPIAKTSSQVVNFNLTWSF